MNIYQCGAVIGHKVYVVAADQAAADKYAFFSTQGKTALYAENPQTIGVPDGSIILFDDIDSKESVRLLEGEKDVRPDTERRKDGPGDGPEFVSV